MSSVRFTMMSALRTVLPLLCLLACSHVQCRPANCDKACQLQRFDKYENDIKVRSSDIRQSRSTEEFNPNKYWPNGVVPYVIGDGLRDETKGFILEALNRMRNATCLQFPQRSSESDYIQFVHEGGCSSYVGRVGGEQTISVGSDDGAITCRVGNILHEILHSIGFIHEHTRSDRDNHIQIIWDNIMHGYEKNFRKETTDVKSTLVPYDYGSILHYGAHFFSMIGHDQDNLTTIETIPVHGVSIGKRADLSPTDIQAANLLYAKPQVSQSGPCANQSR